MPGDRILLVTRGDDLGSNESANRAISDAFRHGILRNASVMAPCPAAADAAARLAGECGICFGLHCTLNAEWDAVRWGPVLPPDEVPSLVDDRGCFLQNPRQNHERGVRLEEVMAELQAQLDKARRLGFDIRYADTHMGFTWIHPGLESAFREWCAREGILPHGGSPPGLPRVAPAGDPVETFIASLAAAPPGRYLVVTHPAYDTPEMRSLGHEGYPGDVVAAERDWDRRLLMDERVLAYCRDSGVWPVRFDE